MHKDARAKRIEIRRLIDAGLDPLEERKRIIEREQAEEAEQRNTFEHIGREWLSKARLGLEYWP